MYAMAKPKDPSPSKTASTPAFSNGWGPQCHPASLFLELPTPEPHHAPPLSNLGALPYSQTQTSDSFQGIPENHWNPFRKAEVLSAMLQSLWPPGCFPNMHISSQYEGHSALPLFPWPQSLFLTLTDHCLFSQVPAQIPLPQRDPLWPLDTLKSHTLMAF